jgi:hypothetical protein
MQGPRVIKADDFTWENLWETDEAKEAVSSWLSHPGYEYFKRRCRIAEVIQLRLAMSSSEPKDSGIFEGMVRVRRLPELMASEARAKEDKGMVVPDTDPDSLHAAMLIFMSEWEAANE